MTRIKTTNYQELVWEHSAARVIAYNPDLARILNSVKAGLLLGHLLYWWGKGFNPDWIYKTHEEIRVETGLSSKEQDAAIKKCKYAGFIQTKRKGIPAKRHFSIDVEAIINALEKYKPLLPYIPKRKIKSA
jgi:hypothetical protein